MVSWELTADQRAIQDMVHKFAEKEIRPLAPEMDEKGKVDFDLLAKAEELGLQSVSIPAEYGGMDLDTVTATVIAEELGWGCSGFGMYLCEDWTSSLPLILFGTDEQKQKWLPRVTEHGALIGMGVTEPNAGCDVANISTTARKDGDYYVLNGTKHFITNGGDAEFYTVFATLDKSKGYKALTPFLVTADAPGFSIGKKENKMGVRCSSTAELILEDVRVPKDQLIGREGLGMGLAMMMLDYGRVTVGAMSVGVARAALEMAVEYAQQRVQFGKPIGVNQGISFKLADMATKVQAARHMIWHAAWLRDQKKNYSKEAAMAKWFASDVCMQVTMDAVQVFGGSGYMREFPLEKWMRDAKIFQIMIGTSEIQQLVIAKHLMPNL
ncbi:MAG: acyl-CoA dehydrogenase family protein [Syntrophobacteraceae bacterium]